MDVEKDIVEDNEAWKHLLAALKETILALNMQPGSYTIARTVMSLQDAISDLKWDIYMDQNSEDDDPFEIPAITDMAQATITSIKEEKAAAEQPAYRQLFGSFKSTRSW